MKSPFLRTLTATFVTIGAAFATIAAEPDGYYSSCENKSGAALLSALYSKVGPHTTVSYDGLWTVYAQSDVKPNGKIWDMYSTKEWPVSSQRCGNYKYVGDCYNREHSFPKSWFDDRPPMVSDAFHIYPTDGKVNGQRSNFPYGECTGGITLPSHNGVDALGRLGTSTFPGYTGKVFEPVNEYKGDFARSYFYMAAAYNTRIASWSSDMLSGDAYPAFKTWAINLLLKWHRQDPVSDKERNRNDAVYGYQKNRNPFIDHPELAEYIWGDKKGQNWTLNASADPKIILPVDGSTIDLGTVSTGIQRAMSVSVAGEGLTEDVTVTITGNGFTASAKTLDAQDVCDGTSLMVYCTAPSVGKHTATMTLTSGKLSSTVTLTANALSGLPASPATAVSDCSFTARWTYVGDTDAKGCYTLYITDADGAAVESFPRAVNAAAESFAVNNLTPSTTYTYWLTSQSLKSNTVSVTTFDPIPSISILYDGDLYLETEPGTPSAAAELLMDVDNIDTDITLSVKAPFELSSDKDVWSTTITVSPVEDRFYLRLNSDAEGSFSSSIKASAGDYVNDDATVQGIATSRPVFIEDFETSAPGGYGGGAFQGSAAKWMLTNAGVYSSKSEAANGNNYLRMGKTEGASSLTLDEDRPMGIGKLTFNGATWSGDGEAGLDIEVSTDQGASWEKITSVTLPASSTSIGNNYKEYTVTINRSGSLRLRFNRTKGKRLGIDDIALTNCTSGVIDGVEYDYHSWDAWCADGMLVVELAEPQHVYVYGVDGIVYANGVMPAGRSQLSLPAGLYIVAVKDFTRRVLVK